MRTHSGTYPASVVYPFCASALLTDLMSPVMVPSSSTNPYSLARSAVSRMRPALAMTSGSAARLATALPLNSRDSPWEKDALDTLGASGLSAEEAFGVLRKVRV